MSLVLALIPALSGCSDLSNLSDAVVEEIAANTTPSAGSFDESPSAAKSAPGDAEASLAPTAPGPEPGTSEAPAAAPQGTQETLATPAAVPQETQETQEAWQGAAVSRGTHLRAPPTQPGAIKEKPAEPAPATPARPSAEQDAVAVTIQLASVTSEGRARELWARYQQSFPDLLGDRELALRREDLGDLGTFYRVRTSRYADRARAESVCGQLKARGQDCRIFVEAPHEEQGRAPVLSDEERRKLFEEFFRARQEG